MTTIEADAADPSSAVPGSSGPASYADRLAIGCSSLAVPGKWNEDRVGLANPTPAEWRSHGLAVAVADGIGGDGSGAFAAAVALRTILRDYYATPVAWGPRKAIDRVLRACNDWLHGQNQRRKDTDAALTTLSVVVFTQDHYHLAHVGDTRVYRFRDGGAKQLTTDHCWPRHDLRHVPKRALGLDSHLVVDYADGVLLPGDTFLLATDGVWEVLGDRQLGETVSEFPRPQACADALVAQAMDRQSRYMGRNDASCALITVAAGTSA